MKDVMFERGMDIVSNEPRTRVPIKDSEKKAIIIYIAYSRYRGSIILRKIMR